MESKETKNMDEVIDEACKNIAELVKAEEADRVREAGQELKVLAKELQGNAIGQRQLMLGAIEVLLVGTEFFDDECLQSLEQSRAYIEKQVSELSENSDNPEQESNDEDMGEGYKGSLDFVVKNIERIFDVYHPPIHRDALRILTDRLPERERRDKEAETREKLVDELLNDILCDVDTATLASFVRESKNNGKLKVPA